MQPRDQLFATLDITAHAGSLPSRMTVIYLDTIGFLSQLPHGLVESFSATLEDVAHSVSVLCWGQVPSRMTRQGPGGSWSSKGHEGKTGRVTPGFSVEGAPASATRWRQRPQRVWRRPAHGNSRTAFVGFLKVCF